MLYWKYGKAVNKNPKVLDKLDKGPIARQAGFESDPYMTSSMHGVILFWLRRPSCVFHMSNVPHILHLCNVLRKTEKDHVFTLHEESKHSQGRLHGDEPFENSESISLLLYSPSLYLGVATV